MPACWKRNIATGSNPTTHRKKNQTMTPVRLSSTLFLASVIVLALAGQSLAQTVTPSATSLKFARSVALACVADWTTQKCLGAVSDSNMTLLSNYGADLQGRKMDAAAETLKQHCAATTAATRQNVPPYAMHSALVECANAMTDLAASTGVQPDPSHYQLLIAPLLCLGADPACPAITTQLQAFIQ